MVARHPSSLIVVLLLSFEAISAADSEPMPSVEIRCEIDGFALETELDELLERLAEIEADQELIERSVQGGFESISLNDLNFLIVDGRVERIYSDKPEFSLSNGIRVGSSIGDVFDALGQTDIQGDGDYRLLAYECSDWQQPDIPRVLTLVTDGDVVVVLGVILNRE